MKDKKKEAPKHPMTLAQDIEPRTSALIDACKATGTACVILLATPPDENGGFMVSSYTPFADGRMPRELGQALELFAKAGQPAADDKAS